MMLIPAALTRDRVVDLLDLVALVDVAQHAIAGGFDAEGEPVEASPLQLVEHAVFHGVDPRIRPDVQIVAPLDDQIADPET